MFDVLVYLYENYWRPDACPDHEQLSRKLSAVGFDTEEIQEALSWLGGIPQGESDTDHPQPGRHSTRVYLPQEQAMLGEECLGFIYFLESAGVLAPALRELVLDRVSAALNAQTGPLALDDLKIIVLMVFWSMGHEPDSLILDELFVAPEDRVIH